MLNQQDSLDASMLSDAGSPDLGAFSQGDLTDKPKMRLPSQAELRSLLQYEPASGKLFWKPRPIEMFKKPWHAPKWNAKFAKKEAFTYVSSTGYRQGVVNFITCSAHRVIWKLETDEEPQAVDHINGVRSDNRWENLRAVSFSLNQRNRKMSRRNTSGHIGVSCSYKKWQATIGTDAGVIRLGSFDTLEEAVSVRKAAEAEHGYHPNHGRRGAVPGAEIQMDDLISLVQAKGDQSPDWGRYLIYDVRDEAERAYRGSFDAAHDLHQFTLPGWRYAVGNGCVTVTSPRFRHSESGRWHYTRFKGQAGNTPRAWLVAILRALGSDYTR